MANTKKQTKEVKNLRYEVKYSLDDAKAHGSDITLRKNILFARDNPDAIKSIIKNK